MTVTLTFGWWLLPTCITAGALAWAFWADRDNSPGAYGAGAFVSLAIYSAAIIVPLLAWLIWSLA